jgi:polyphosphate kinase
VIRTLIPKEISWLSFNDRVLQESADPSVPLFERLKFLGIYSSNMDEFFHVRVADLQRFARGGKKATKLLGYNPKMVLASVQRMVLEQGRKYQRTYRVLLKDLKDQGVFIINEKRMTPDQGRFVEAYFREEVHPRLIPIMIDQIENFPELKDQAIYLVTMLSHRRKGQKKRYALIEVPTAVLPRFLVLPDAGKNRYVILLDDVIRHCLKDIFALLPFDRFSAYTIKITRDAELDIDQDLADGVVKKMARSLRKRKFGSPVRLIYDSQMPKDLLRLLTKRLKLHKHDSLFPGGRYHNMRDFMKFPRFGSPRFFYKTNGKLPHRLIHPRRSLFETIERRDVLLHVAYQSFDYILDLLREASMDPSVTSIRMTIYRAAEQSSVMNALINAVRNGKSVTVVMELQARFDEEANILWSNRLRDAGVRVIYGVPGLKVHAKLCLITRNCKDGERGYAVLGTGNFNEKTAPYYSDHILFTANPEITREVGQVFEFFRNNFRVGRYKELIVSPFNTRSRLKKWISREIRNAHHGRPAFIWIKANNVADSKVIQQLYEASQAGVSVRLIVRSMFSLMAGVPGMSDNIQAVSIVDKYLEHSRIFVFGNGGRPRYYLSSADLMGRNLDRRVEVTFPILDRIAQQELQTFLDIQWQDNVKARVLNPSFDNRLHRGSLSRRTRAQWRFESYLKRQLTSGRRMHETGGH